MSDANITISRIVRIGKVSSINESKREARVFFPDLGIMSGNLKIINNTPFIPERGEEQSTEAAEDGHKHPLRISPWTPEIGENVLCLFLPVRGGDGIVIGGI